MSKLRSNFNKVPSDQYFSYDPRIGESLKPYLPKQEFTFIEPFAGKGHLIDQIQYYCPHAKLISAFDIENSSTKIIKIDIRNAKINSVPDYFISNPPFSRSFMKLTKEQIIKFRKIAPTWMLLPFATACNKGFAEQMEYCTKIVPVGRIRWIPNSEHDETKDIAWFKFVQKKKRTILEERHISKFTPSEITELAKTWN